MSERKNGSKQASKKEREGRKDEKKDEIGRVKEDGRKVKARRNEKGRKEGRKEGNRKEARRDNGRRKRRRMKGKNPERHYEEGADRPEEGARRIIRYSDGEARKKNPRS